MADKSINQLTQATDLTDSSLFVIEQNSTAKQANWGMMKNYISPGVAAQYSTSAKYNVGDYVIYNDSLYRCNTAITTGEAWTAAHWTAAVLGNDFGELKRTIIAECIVPVTWEQGRLSTTGGLVSSNYAIRSKDFISVDNKRRSISILFGDYSLPSGSTNLSCTIYEYSSTSPATLVTKTEKFKSTGNFTISFDATTVAFKVVLQYMVAATYLLPPSCGYLITPLWNKDGLPQWISGVESKIDTYIPTGYEISTDAPSVKYEDAYIGLDGKKHSTTAGSGISITDLIEMNAGDVLKFKCNTLDTQCAIAETDADFSFYNVLEAGTGTTSTFTVVAYKRMWVCATVNTTVGYSMKMTRKLQYSFSQPIDMAVKGVINNWGMTALNYSIGNYRFSKPIKVYEGDIIQFTGYVVNTFPMIVKYFDRFNTYSASTLGSAKVVALADTTGTVSKTWIADETCFIVLQAVIGSVTPECIISRSYDGERTVQINDEYTAETYSITNHNYVDQYDFVPNLEKKRTNSILTYYGDDKKANNFMVNAVAYPNGEIIACRAGGQVVKVANDGTETVLMTIENAQDWRGMFMDSNLNVYVSPHSSTFSPGIAATDRGLYKLTYGGHSFTKVINLCRSTTEITKWDASTAYAVGDKVMRDNQSDFYICSEAHTSSSTFDPTKWTAVSAWSSNTAYAVGALCKYNSCYYRCTTAHTSGASFDVAKWHAATEYMDNDDTIWTMCEDDKGYLYAGVYSHSTRANPAVYRSTNGGNYFVYQHNFIMNGTLPESRYGYNNVRHVHCINFNNYDNCLYAAVGEVNTIVRSANRGAAWKDLQAPSFYGQPTYVLGVKDGLVIGSDGHYSCGVSKLMTDGKTMKLCGRTAPGFIFNIRRSDLTGWLYAWTRIDNYVQSISTCPPPEAIDDPTALEDWLDTYGNTNAGGMWQDYHTWAEKYYPEDAIRPQNAVIMVSRDEGETWEVIRTEKVSANYAPICGFITVGYFRDGECLCGFLKPIENTQNGKAFYKPIIVTEGKKKRTASGFDLNGEIFIKTNNSDIVSY